VTVLYFSPKSIRIPVQLSDDAASFQLILDFWLLWLGRIAALAKMQPIAKKEYDWFVCLSVCLSVCPWTLQKRLNRLRSRFGMTRMSRNHVLEYPPRKGKLFGVVWSIRKCCNLNCDLCKTAERLRLRSRPIFRGDMEEGKKTTPSSSQRSGPSLPPINVFTARRYAKRGICRRRVSVCLSVCLSVHSGIVSKRLNWGSRK